jgi:uncharacterized alpha-E superfamily protein
VLDLVLVDDANPRSVAYQAGRIVEHLGAVADGRRPGPFDPVLRPALKLIETVGRRDGTTAFGRAWIAALERELMAVSDAITRRWFADAAPLADPDPAADAMSDRAGDRAAVAEAAP